MERDDKPLGFEEKVTDTLFSDKPKWWGLWNSHELVIISGFSGQYLVQRRAICKPWSRWTRCAHPTWWEPRAQHVVYKDMFLLEHTKDASVRNCHFIRFAVAWFQSSKLGRRSNGYWTWCRNGRRCLAGEACHGCREDCVARKFVTLTLGHWCHDSGSHCRDCGLDLIWMPDWSGFPTCTGLNLQMMWVQAVQVC